MNQSSFTDGELYYLSIYYGLTIFTTIGFGSVRATNTIEYEFSALAFIFGAIYYTIFTGILSSVFSNMFFKDLQINIKKQTCEQMCRLYKVSLYINIK